MVVAHRAVGNTWELGPSLGAYFDLVYESAGDRLRLRSDFQQRPWNSPVIILLVSLHSVFKNFESPAGPFGSPKQPHIKGSDNETVFQGE